MWILAAPLQKGQAYVCLRDDIYSDLATLLSTSSFWLVWEAEPTPRYDPLSFIISFAPPLSRW